MGGRYASRVISYYRDKHGRFTRYGEEYRCELTVGNIMFVSRESKNGYKDPPTAPLETRTRGRIYVTIGKNGQPKTITYYDKHGRRKAQIDLDHMHKGERPHKHGGYNHNRDVKMTKLDHWLVKHVAKLWKDHAND